MLDDELFDVLPQFLPDVLAAGFVADDPPATRLAPDDRFRATRRYARADGAVFTATLVLARSTTEGATATLGALETNAANGHLPATVAGFPALARSLSGGGQIINVVLTPRLQIDVQFTGLPPNLVDALVNALKPGYLAQAEGKGRLASEALGSAQVFDDAQGQKVEMAMGRNAFADRVISTHPGPRQGPHHDPNLALGPPDYDGQSGFYTLGCRGTLEVAFDDNALVDGPGPDLHIFEIGKFVESMGIRISEDGQSWLEAGQVRGQPASLDIGKVAKPGAQYRFVEITDLGDECDNDSAGADVDAVGTINGQLVGSPAPAPEQRPAKLANPVVAGDDVTVVAEAVRKSEGVPLSVTAHGKGFTLSEASTGYTVQVERLVQGAVAGRADTVLLSTKGVPEHMEHWLEVYTQGRSGLSPLAQAFVASGGPGPESATLRVEDGRIAFSMEGKSLVYELRGGSQGSGGTTLHLVDR